MLEVLRCLPTKMCAKLETDTERHACARTHVDTRPFGIAAPTYLVVKSSVKEDLVNVADLFQQIMTSMYFRIIPATSHGSRADLNHAYGAELTSKLPYATTLSEDFYFLSSNLKSPVWRL